MPPSTVFSYWRRRSNASPVPLTSQPTSKQVLGTSNPPQLPLIADSTNLTGAFDEKFTIGESLALRPPTQDTLKFDGRDATASEPSLDAPSPSIAALPVDSSSEDLTTRPRTTFEERDRGHSTVTSRSNFSQVSPASDTPDQTNGESSKATSPYQLPTGKSPLSPQSTDGPLQRSTSPGMAPSSHRRFRSSADESPGDRVAAGSQREYRFEGPTSRRQYDAQPVEPVPQRSSKTMLHLLNPMSLLAKRRAHQMAGLRADDVNKGSRNLVPAIPDDYDPRIRGNIVHDFSAPRPRRQLSTAPAPLPEQAGQPSPSSATQHGYTGNDLGLRGSDSVSPFSHPVEHGKRHSDHSPVFREHFEDDKRTLQVENKAYLQSPLLTDAKRERDSHSLPVFARKLPSSITDDSDQSVPEPSKPSSLDDIVVDNAETLEEDSDTFDVEPQQPSGLPKHFKSNASRFSFDMNGVGSSTQEKLLEEKHKEKEAARKARARLNGDFSDVEDDYDNDMFDDMDGLEEEIPGVNVDDDEEDDFRDFSGPGNILNKSWLAPNLSPVIASPIHPEMPYIQNEQAPSLGHEEAEQNTADRNQDAYFETDDVSDSSKTFFRESRDLSATPLHSVPEDDDLYFDDGEFGELDTEETGVGFDESIFDDPTSHLYERKQVSIPLVAEQTGPEGVCLEAGPNDGLKHASSIASDHHQGFAPRRYGSVAGNMLNPELVRSHSGILSEHNLEAFHNALADAADQAATKSRLGYTTSVSERSIGQESTARTLDSQPGLISDESQISQVMDPVSLDEVFEEFDFDDNDDLYDDPIIAAANAEALENDDEGIYGQEFGFYAQAYGNGSELTHGGYFGPRGVEGISRSHSGRGKFREPSLTPITERSEWSTRNSIISVAAHGVAHSSQSVPSPGLAQLVDMGNLDDEMSLGALMKLRRDAWGGSNGSLRSSSGSPPPQQGTTSNRGSFTFSDVSPTVHTVPPDFLGGPNTIDSPVRESAWPCSFPPPRSAMGEI